MSEGTLTNALEELGPWWPAPPEGQVLPAYQPVEVRPTSASWPLPAVITAWWRSPEQVTVCRLRMSPTRPSRWVTFDAERIVPLVQGGT